MQATFSHEVFADLLSTVDETLDEVSMLCIFLHPDTAGSERSQRSLHTSKVTCSKARARMVRAVLFDAITHPLEPQWRTLCILCNDMQQGQGAHGSGQDPMMQRSSPQMSPLLGDTAAVPHIVRCTVLLVHFMPIIEREMLRPSAEPLTAAAILACVAELSCSMSSQQG